MTDLGPDGTAVAFQVSAEDLAAAQADTANYEVVPIVVPIPSVPVFDGGCDVLPRAGRLWNDPPFRWVTQAYQGLGVVGASPHLRVSGVLNCVQGFRTLDADGREQFLFFVGTWSGSRTEEGSVVSVRQVLPPGRTILVENPPGAGAVGVWFEPRAGAPTEVGQVAPGRRRTFTSPREGDSSILVIERPPREGPQAPIRLYAHSGPSVNESM